MTALLSYAMSRGIPHPAQPQYDRYYELFTSIPFARRIAETLASSVYSSYSLDNGIPTQRNSIESYFSQTNFRAIFRAIVEDTVLYGDSYLDILNRNPLFLMRIDPYQRIFRLGESPEESAVVGRKIGVDVIQFSHRTSNSPFGSSALGESWDAWLEIANSIKATSKGNKSDAISNRDYFENQILAAADQMPDIVATRNLQRFILPLTVDRSSPFALAVGRRREELRRVVEMRIFPLILNKEWTSNNWVEFRIQGNLRLT
jgi:hypothetical protein